MLVSLPTPDIVKAVALGNRGIIEGTRARVLVDLSTTGPGAAKIDRRRPEAQEHHTGRCAGQRRHHGAVGGTLAVMVSCPKATYEEVEPILKNFGKLFYTGEKPGLAQTAKLANNLLAAAAWSITSEAMAMGVKAGLDPQVMIDIINASSGRNSATRGQIPPRRPARHL